MAADAAANSNPVGQYSTDCPMAGSSAAWSYHRIWTSPACARASMMERSTCRFLCRRALKPRPYPLRKLRRLHKLRVRRQRSFVPAILSWLLH